MRSLVTVVLTIAILGSVAFLLLRSPDPGLYRLIVINNTAATIDRIRLFGTAAAGDAVYEQLQAGQSAELLVKLNDQGQLRFEVMRGYNRIDAIFETDVATTERQQQWLLLHDNNRFVLKDQAPQN